VSDRKTKRRSDRWLQLSSDTPTQALTKLSFQGNVVLENAVTCAKKVHNLPRGQQCMEDLGTGQKKSIIANAHLERAVGVLHEHGWLWADQASKLLEEAKGNLATLESLPAFAEQFAETCRVLGTVLVHKNATHGNAELARGVLN